MDINDHSSNNSHINKDRISWSMILSGFFITLAIFLTLMTLGISLGLAVMDFENGISLTATTWFSGLWSVMSFLVALAFSTYVIARMNIRSSITGALVNGLTIWAIVSVFTFYVVTKSSGQIIASSSKIVANQVEGIASSLGPNILSEDVVDNLYLSSFKDMYKDIKAPELKASVESELEKLKLDASNFAKEVLLNPKSADANVGKFKESAKNSVKSLSEQYSEDDIAKIIARNSELSASEAQEASKEWHARLEKLPSKIDSAFSNFESKAVDMADSAKNSVATTSFLLFLFFCFGLIVSTVSSIFASKKN